MGIFDFFSKKKQSDFKIESEEQKLANGSSVVLVKVIGSIEADLSHHKTFEDSLIDPFTRGVKYAIVDISQVSFINESMGMFVKITDRFQNAGGDLLLVGVPKKVLNLLDMLGLLAFFKQYDTNEQALKYLNT